MKTLKQIEIERKNKENSINRIGVNEVLDRMELSRIRKEEIKGWFGEKPDVDDLEEYNEKLCS